MNLNTFKAFITLLFKKTKTMFKTDNNKLKFYQNVKQLLG